MAGILYALVVIATWGTWLAVSQVVPYKNQQIRTFYVAGANLVLAFIVYLIKGRQDFSGFSWSGFWLPFIGGILWAVSGYLAFTASDKLGLARAFGIWSPLNAVTALVWGILIFGEFLQAGALTIVLLVVALAVIIAGILMIIFAKGFGKKIDDPAAFRTGILAALGAGILWGSYFIPVRMSNAGTWAGAFPLAIGIFAGSALLVAMSRQPIRLNQTSHTIRSLSAGLMWGIGNYAMLLLVGQLGAGRGFTISQLGIVVNSLIGVYILKDPAPKSRAAVFTLVGCFIATGGAILLGTLK